MTLAFGHPGDGGLGDRLLAAVLRGEKTATSSLAEWVRLVRSAGAGPGARPGG